MNKSNEYTPITIDRNTSFKTDKEYRNYLLNDATDHDFADTQATMNQHRGIFNVSDVEWINQIAKERRDAKTMTDNKYN